MAVFQLLVYCEAWNDMEKSDSHIQPVLHRVRMIGPENGITPLTFGISRAKVPVEFPGCSGDFRPRLNALVEEIFNPDKPFTQTQDAHNCKFCPFLSMCGRTVPEDF